MNRDILYNKSDFTNVAYVAFYTNLNLPCSFFGHYAPLSRLHRRPLAVASIFFGIKHKIETTADAA